MKELTSFFHSDLISRESTLSLGAPPHQPVKLSSQSIFKHWPGISLQPGWLPVKDAGKSGRKKTKHTFIIMEKYKVEI